MLLAVPNGTTRGDPEDPSSRQPPQPSTCEPATNPASETSCDNRYLDNNMGTAPRGFRPSVAVNKFGNPSSLGGGKRNGVDFWWDEFAGNEGNCWRGNVGPDGTRDSLTADPVLGPLPGQNVPKTLPEECDPDGSTYSAGIGTGNAFKEAVLANCALFYEPGNDAEDHPGCDWFTTPPEPGTQAAAREQRESEEAASRFERTDEAERIRERLRSLSTVSPR
jgi:hypothetical protein